jgi:hypothetical protein
MGTYSAEHERLLGKLLLDPEFLGYVLDPQTRLEALQSLNVADPEKLFEDIEAYLIDHGETLDDLVDDVDAGVVEFLG